LEELLVALEELMVDSAEHPMLPTEDHLAHLEEPQVPSEVDLDMVDSEVLSVALEELLVALEELMADSVALPMLPMEDNLAHLEEPQEPLEVDLDSELHPLVLEVLSVALEEPPEPLEELMVDLAVLPMLPMEDNLAHSEEPQVLSEVDLDMEDLELPQLDLDLPPMEHPSVDLLEVLPLELLEEPLEPLEELLEPLVEPLVLLELLPMAALLEDL
jgi:hypothetical protein